MCNAYLNICCSQANQTIRDLLGHFFIGMQMRFIWSSKVWELDHDLNKLCVRFVLCAALGLNWALIVKSLKIVWAHSWNIWMCNRDALWYHQRNRFVRYKEINLISFMRTHKKNSLASQTQTYKAAATKLYLQIEFLNW